MAKKNWRKKEQKVHTNPTRPIILIKRTSSQIHGGGPVDYPTRRDGPKAQYKTPPTWHAYKLLDLASKSKPVGPVRKSHATISVVCGKHRVLIETPNNTANKQKAVGSTTTPKWDAPNFGWWKIPLAPLAPVPPHPRGVSTMVDPPRRNTSSDVQYQIVGSPKDEQQGVPFTEVVMADELPANHHIPTIAEYDGTTDPKEYLSHFENAALLRRYTDGIKCRVFITTLARAAQQWFNQLPVGVIQRIGKVVYRLDLPPHTKIRSTFHVSQLKKCHGESIAPRSLPVMLTPRGHLVLEPEAILDKRIILFHNRPLMQILVKWFNTPTEDIIWENYYEFM
ncbi:hypothetical protein Sango_0356800 [Sesamum angolense]|uniref:Tf2-1-like SH3-like domain-containing protein n=1 Tax=Sesamum angolense TaxID=2727404 RepID=A0AAE1XAB3_9LAMI|nr:hypothetical protein Sango_0356800 [Sesamum angolense]